MVARIDFEAEIDIAEPLAIGRPSDVDGVPVGERAGVAASILALSVGDLEVVIFEVGDLRSVRGIDDLSGHRSPNENRGLAAGEVEEPDLELAKVRDRLAAGSELRAGARSKKGDGIDAVVNELDQIEDVERALVGRIIGGRDDNLPVWSPTIGIGTGVFKRLVVFRLVRNDLVGQLAVIEAPGLSAIDVDQTE